MEKTEIICEVLAFKNKKYAYNFLYLYKTSVTQIYVKT